MDVFNLTLEQMLMLFLLIIMGFFLRKKKIVPDDTFTVLSKLETFVFVPALNLFNMMTNCNTKTFVENSSLILYGLICVVVLIILSYPISRLYVRKADTPDKLYLRNIYKYASVFGNYGYVGNFIVLGIWGEEMFFKYSMFTFLISMACSSWGLFILIPKDKNAGVIRNIIKGFSTPPMIALVVGVLFGLTGLSKFVPTFVYTTLDNAKACMGPVAMLLAGVVIGGYNFKSLLTDKKVYISAAMRLIFIPAAFVLVLRLLGIGEEIQLFAFICFACPLGLNTIIYPAAYGGDTRTGASMATISHILSVITIPLMYLLLFVVL